MFEDLEAFVEGAGRYARGGVDCVEEGFVDCSGDLVESAIDQVECECCSRSQESQQRHDAQKLVHS